MRYHFTPGAEARRAELVASFGAAQIVKHLDGRLEIRGGSESEKFQAHDWMKKYLSGTPLTLRRLR